MAFHKDGAAAKKTSELLENATLAIKQLWMDRKYDPSKPGEIKAKLGYTLDKYEAAAYLVTGAMHLPLLSPPEAWSIGKRIKNVIGPSGTIGAKLKALRKRGKCTVPQCEALLQALAPLNLELPPRQPVPMPPLAAPPLTPSILPLVSPDPPSMPPPSLPVPIPAVESSPPIDYSSAGDLSQEFHSTERHPEIPGYRGRAMADVEEIYWNPAKAPCVPSDHRPEELFNSQQAAEAAGAAAGVEKSTLTEHDEDNNEESMAEEYELACVRHKYAMRRLRLSFPEVADDGSRRPCPCGLGALAMWPWVVQTAELGFCVCIMAQWELICWRSEWISTSHPYLRW